MSNAIAVLDFWVIHTVDVSHHQDQCVNQIHAHQMDNASFKKTVNQFASVHLEWVEIRQQLVVMDMNVVLIVIAQNITLV